MHVSGHLAGVHACMHAGAPYITCNSAPRALVLSTAVAHLCVPLQCVQAFAGEDVPKFGRLVSRRGRQVCAIVREFD
jgi:hypothetical protein